MKKRNLIFLHGGPGFRDYLQPYFKDLNNRFNCVFYDQLRGAEVDIDALVVQLAEQVALHPNSILVGHSWGGVLGLEFAKRHSEKLAGLVLLCSGISYSQWLEYHKDLYKLGLTHPTQEQIFLVDGDVSGGKQFLEQVSSTFSEETFNHLFQSYLEKFDLTNDLANLKMKVLNIFSQKDLRFPARVARTNSTLNPKIINYELYEVGHFPFLQDKVRKVICQIFADEFCD